MWDGAATTVSYATAGVEVDTVVVWHDLPEGALVELQLDGTPIEQRPITDRFVTVFHVDPVTAAQISVAVTNATGGRLYWVDAGNSLTPRYSASELQLSERYNEFGDVQYAAVSYGTAFDAEIEYDRALDDAGYKAIGSMYRYVKANQNSPIVFTPNVNFPEEARVGRLQRVLTATEWGKFQPAQSNRLYSANLQLTGVYN